MSSYVTAPRGRGFAESVDICLRKYVDFEGRAPRSEYWFWVLFCVCCSLVITFAFGMFDVLTGTRTLGHLARFGFSALIFLPSLAVSVRRLHDTDRTGLWYLLIFLPLIGGLILLIWYCMPGTYGFNRFGPDPINRA